MQRFDSLLHDIIIAVLRILLSLKYKICVEGSDTVLCLAEIITGKKRQNYCKFQPAIFDTKCTESNEKTHWEPGCFGDPVRWLIMHACIYY